MKWEAANSCFLSVFGNLEKVYLFYRFFLLSKACRGDDICFLEAIWPFFLCPSNEPFACQCGHLTSSNGHIASSHVDLTRSDALFAS